MYIRIVHILQKVFENLTNFSDTSAARNLEYSEILGRIEVLPGSYIFVRDKVSTSPIQLGSLKRLAFR